MKKHLNITNEVKFIISFLEWMNNKNGMFLDVKVEDIIEFAKDFKEHESKIKCQPIPQENSEK